MGGALGAGVGLATLVEEIPQQLTAAGVPALSLILSAIVITLPIVLIFNVWVYWRMFGLSRPPLPPSFKG